MFVGMLTANGYANWDDFLSYAGKPERQRIDGWLYGTGPLCRLYRARDGWICLSLPEDEQAGERWSALCSAAGRPELAADERFRDAAARAAHRDELSGALEAVFATRDADTWEQSLIAAGVGCVRADSYASAGGFFLRDEQMHANGFAPVAAHALLGEYQRWGPLVTFSETPGRYGPGVPAGENSDAILAELGYGPAEIADLYARGVVRARARGAVRVAAERGGEVEDGSGAAAGEPCHQPGSGWNAAVRRSTRSDHAVDCPRVAAGGDCRRQRLGSDGAGSGPAVAAGRAGARLRRHPVQAAIVAGAVP